MDSKKVIMMTKLATYDKKYAKKDKRINSYFQHDYVYVQNAWTRFFVLIGCVIVMGIWFLSKIVSNQIGEVLLNYKYYGTRWSAFVLGIIVVYTAVSYVLAYRRYEKSRKRLEAYNRALLKINTMGYDKNIK